MREQGHAGGVDAIDDLSIQPDLGADVCHASFPTVLLGQSIGCQPRRGNSRSLSVCSRPGPSAGPWRVWPRSDTAVESYAMADVRELSRNGKGRHNLRDTPMPGKADTAWRCWREINTAQYNRRLANVLLSTINTRRELPIHV
jgi:hypothetical protein